MTEIFCRAVGCHRKKDGKCEAKEISIDEVGRCAICPNHYY